MAPFPAGSILARTAIYPSDAMCRAFMPSASNLGRDALWPFGGMLTRTPVLGSWLTRLGTLFDACKRRNSEAGDFLGARILEHGWSSCRWCFSRLPGYASPCFTSPMLVQQRSDCFHQVTRRARWPVTKKTRGSRLPLGLVKRCPFLRGTNQLIQDLGCISSMLAGKAKKKVNLGS